MYNSPNIIKEMYLLCMNKNLCKQDLIVVFFFYKCVGLLSFSVTAYYISLLHKEKKECGKTLLIDHSIHLLTHVYMHLKTST